MPLNYLAVEGLRENGRVAGDSVTVELPTGSGRQATLAEAGDELARRLSSIFLADADSRRPVLASYGRLQDDPEYRDLVPFHEYFHAETGAGLGASHQTGWTALVASLIDEWRR
jgi:hypothetical protein